MMRRTFALLLCAALLAGLAGCGGGGSSSTTTATATTSADIAVIPPPSQNVEPTAAEPTAAKPTAEKSTGKQRETGSTTRGRSSEAGRESSDTRPKEAPKKTAGSAKRGHGAVKAFKPVKVPRISHAPVAGSKKPAPGVKTTAGADNSVQEYGVEADEAARTEAAIALQSYLNARAQEEWTAACSFLAQAPTEQLEAMAARETREGRKLEGCPATLADLREVQSAMREQATIADVLSFRGEGEVEGNPSYLIFAGLPGKTLYSMPMYLEGGAWKVGLGRPAELPVGGAA